MMTLKYKQNHRKPALQELILWGLSLCFFALAVLAAFVLIRELRSDRKAEETYASLAETMSDMDNSWEDEAWPSLSTSVPEAESEMQLDAPPETSDAETQENTQQDAGEPQMISKFAELIAQNADLCGWISLPGAGISYPVMWTPDDPEYYLRRDFYGDYSRSGTPFVGKGCTVDSDCLLIYGHNMRNGTMFSGLTEYETQDFWEENPTFHFNTPYEYRKYQIFAQVTCRLSENEAEGFEYYQYSGDMTEVQFMELRYWLLKHAAYETGYAPEYGDQILILSTCGTRYDDERIIVAAYRLPEA